jgi:UDP-N-acetylmuramoyl-L-alanyl-D-glutamate--2,6-diaminopimelate ligase
MKFMTLRKLLQGLTPHPLPPIPVTGVACHSKQLQAGEVFVAVRGTHHDGHDFLDEAVRRGACAVVVERPPAEPLRCPVIVIPNTKQALAVIAARFYDEPASRLRLVGVTGTNGKTTTAYLMKAILEAAGHRVGLLGTVSYEIGHRRLPSLNTTPGSLELHRLLSQMVEQGLTHCSMEVSSHALDQGRIEGLAFEAAVFTNLGSDHLDYHQTRERYAAAKRRLFTYLRPGSPALINTDDPYGRTLIGTLNGNPVLTYGIEQPAAISCRTIRCAWEGTSLVLETPWGVIAVDTPLVGRHNILNIASSCGTCLALGVSVSAVQHALANFPQVPGRMERVRHHESGILAVIDYAHTADALRLVLLSLRELVCGRLIVVFGCGGNRDQTKRPAMGYVASVLADHVVLTSDNPRNEDPLDIIHHVKAGFVPGFREYHVAVDRESAIHLALSMARSDDAVLIAGKGHEAYQIFDHIAVPFSDRDVVERYWSSRHSVVVA